MSDLPFNDPAYRKYSHHLQRVLKTEPHYTGMGSQKQTSFPNRGRTEQNQISQWVDTTADISLLKNIYEYIEHILLIYTCKYISIYMKSTCV